MRIKINGKPEDIEEKNILDILKAKNVEPRMVAVEVNGELIERDNYETTILKEGDEIEFLYFMGGGVN